MTPKAARGPVGASSGSAALTAASVPAPAVPERPARNRGGSAHGERAVHDRFVRLAVVLVRPLRELDRHRLRAGVADVGDLLLELRAPLLLLQHEVVRARLVGDLERIGAGGELLDGLAVLLQRDGVAPADGSAQRLPRGPWGCPGGRDERPGGAGGGPRAA